MSDLLPWPPPPEMRSAEEQVPLLQAHIARMAEVEATLRSSLAAAEGEVRHLKGAVDTLTASGQEWRNRALAAERARDEAREALREIVGFFPTKKDTWDGWTDIGPCPCYDGGEGWECSCDEEARRISLKLTVARARAVLEGGK